MPDDRAMILDPSRWPQEGRLYVKNPTTDEHGMIDVDQLTSVHVFDLTTGRLQVDHERPFGDIDELLAAGWLVD